MVVSAMAVTHAWTAEGWLYVAAVLDLSSRRVVGWSMKAERDALLVVDALMMAVWRHGEADALLHHSDQGSQYTSEQGTPAEAEERYFPSLDQTAMAA